MPGGSARTRRGRRGMFGGRAERLPPAAGLARPSAVGQGASCSFEKGKRCSRGWRRPEFHKTGRDDSALLPLLARPSRPPLPPRGGRGVLGTGLLIRDLGGSVLAFGGGGGEILPREAGRVFAVVP